jgi:hypothetical protein
MFKNDSLYQNLYQRIEKNNLSIIITITINENRIYPATINYNNCEENNDPRSGLFVYFKHLMGGIFNLVFDVGSMLEISQLNAVISSGFCAKKILRSYRLSLPTGLLVP